MKKHRIKTIEETPFESTDESVRRQERKVYQVGVRHQDVCKAHGQMVVRHLSQIYPEALFNLSSITCEADRFSLSPLSAFVDASAYTQDLDEALKNETVDLVIQPLEECKPELDQEIEWVALTVREDARDLLVFPQNKKIDDLKAGDRIGYFSKRQLIQFNRLIPDLQYRFTTGDVLPRLEKLVRGELDALLISAIDIIRLNPTQYPLIYQPISPEILCPPPGRGILVIKALKRKSKFWLPIRKALDNASSRACFAVEQMVFEALGKPFDEAVGIYCTEASDSLFLRAINGMGFNQQKALFQLVQEKLTNDISERLDALPEKKMKIVNGSVGRPYSLVPDLDRVHLFVRRLTGKVSFAGLGYSGFNGLMTEGLKQALNKADVILCETSDQYSLVMNESPLAKPIYMNHEAYQFVYRYAQAKGIRFADLNIDSSLPLYTNLLNQQEVSPDDLDEVELTDRCFYSHFLETPVAVLMDCLRRGYRVVRLFQNNTDLMRIGHFESRCLEAAGLSFEWLPGVSEIQTAMALMGLPSIPDQQQGQHILDARYPISEALFRAMATGGGTWFIEHAIPHLPDLTIGFQRAGIISTAPAILYADIGTLNQKVIHCTVATMMDQGVSQNMPVHTTLVIGEAASAKYPIAWWPSRGPLAGKSVFLLSSQLAVHQRDELAAGVEELGGNLCLLEWIKTQTNEQLEQLLDQAFKHHLDTVEAQKKNVRTTWFVFFSTAGVEAFAQSIHRLKLDIRQLSDMRFATLNDQVRRALQNHGIKADFVGNLMHQQDDGDEEIFAQLIVNETKAADTIIAIRGSRPLSGASLILQQANRQFVEWIGYETTPIRMSRRNLLSTLDQIHLLIFTGAGTVLSFANALAEVGLGAQDLLDRQVHILAQGSMVKKTLEQTHLYASSFCRVLGHEALLAFLNQMR